jgi:hypothetical protein
MSLDLEDYIKGLKTNLDGLLGGLANQQKELLKKLTPEEKKSYDRTMIRAKEMAKKGDVHGLNKLKK